MMRRTVLLVATTALTLIAAGGIALAATITCATNPCDGTPEDDMITGTLNAETINGNAGNDEISARDANDTLHGEDGNDTLHGEDGNDTMHGQPGDDRLDGGDGSDQLFGENGTDRLNGGAGNDTLDGSPATEPEDVNDYYDYYLFAPNWGNDTIIDSRGRGAISVADAAAAAAMRDLTVNLVSDPTRPEISDGNGNTMNWEADDVMSVGTGAGDDVISMRPKAGDLVNGGAGSDTYTGYTTEPTGEDSINDPSGTDDVLDLSSSINLGDAYWRIWKNSATGNVRTLQLWTGPPGMCVEEFCRDVFLNRYFDDTSTDVCASGPGPGVIETIKFANGQSADFERVKRMLGCPTPDTKAPTVSNVVPADGEQNVSTGTYYVETTFHEPMDPDTINTSTFVLTKEDSSTPVEATVGYDSYEGYYSVAWLSPNSELAPNTTYTATIKGGASGAKDLAGNALQEDYSWSFTTGTDTTPPETFIDSGPSGTVSSTSDSFSFSSNESDATFECKLDNETFKSCTSPKIVPDQDFLTEGTHTFEVRATDSDGNTDPTPDSRTWTVDATAPTISNVSPTNQSQNVSLGTNVEITFSEAMNASTLTTGTFTLTKQNSSTPVGATVSHSSTTNKATLDPSSDLASNTTYTATIKGGTTGAKDSAGNALAQDYSWTFTTGAPPDTTAPRVSTATPTGTGVARGTNATATFSERMDPATITTSTYKLFRCSSTTSTDCATQITNVTVTKSADRLKATLNPFGTSSTLLAGRTKFKVVLTTGAKDEAGNQLDQDTSMAGNQQKVWYFTTGRS